MATLIYVTGNGYHCHCCRSTNTDYIDFDEDDDGIKYLIRDCISQSRSADGDFYIEAIKGYSGDETELENKISAAISADEARVKNEREIQSIKRSIAEIEQWFSTLDATKASKTKALETHRAKLAELEK